jgi:hypothetical protein
MELDASMEVSGGAWSSQVWQWHGQLASETASREAPPLAKGTAMSVVDATRDRARRVVTWDGAPRCGEVTWGGRMAR